MFLPKSITSTKHGAEHPAHIISNKHVRGSDGRHPQHGNLKPVMRTLDHMVAMAVAMIVYGALPLVAAEDLTVEANRVAEVEIVSEKTYANPFLDVTLDAIVRTPDGKELRVPAFWAGGDRWAFRYSSAVKGEHPWTLDCSDKDNRNLNGRAGRIEVVPYRGDNALYRHGPIRVAGDMRHFEHADGTPYLWLADTWWKGLCKRMTWEGFQELTADRKAKGFNAVQIVCGPYPDEAMMEPRWENEGGMPYLKKDFSEVNPVYFGYADRRFQHLVDAGIMPVIVGGWGRPQGGGQSTLMQVGIDGYKRHWRNLVARYGAYPVVWIVGGEAKDAYGPWSELAGYLKETDPFKHLVCYHAPGDPRAALKDNSMFDFDMIAIGHDGLETANATIGMMKSCFDAPPKRPALCGEASYEGHMQTNFQAIQRHMFWSFMLSGAAGHTYGAAGIWQAGVEGDPGITPVYDWTTWKEGMNYPGAAQVGLGKKLLEKYPWQRFDTHPEWVADGCYAAGIPGEVRFIYQPLRNIYNWSGPLVKGLDPSVRWHVYYFDPATGRTFDQGNIVPTATVGDSKAKPVEFRKNVPSPQDWVLVFEKMEPE